MRASAHHNNARLRAFLDAFGFEYEFLSATECYRAGRFDKALLTVLERYDAVMAIMLPSLREERQQTYSPFLPIHPRTGHVMQVPIEERKVDAGTIVWKDPADGRAFRDAGDRRPREAAMEARLGDALGRPRRRLRDGRQGPDREREALRARSRAPSAACRRRASTTSSFSTKRGRRSRSRRATA